MEERQVEASFGHFIQAPEKVGLVDGGHVVLSCSSCGEGLVDIWLTQPDAPFQWKGQALCCYCGDHSFVQSWKGRFAPGPFATAIPNPDPDAPDDARIRLVIRKIEPRGDVLVFHTAKAEEE